jgi:hypothetical protein
MVPQKEGSPGRIGGREAHPVRIMRETKNLSVDGIALQIFLKGGFSRKRRKGLSRNILCAGRVKRSPVIEDLPDMAYGITPNFFRQP